MAKYIKKEIVDLNGSGSTKAYYKLKTWRRLDFDEFVERQGTAKGCLDGIKRASGIRDFKRLQRED